jgi:DNA-binding response OmpR family regulator
VKEFHDTESIFVFLKEKIPDLLILDLMLPDADGLEICKNLKLDEKLSSIGPRSSGFSISSLQK